MPDPAVRDALRRATGGLPAHEDRPAQVAMAEAVGAALSGRRHLIVQAGTGTGKSLGYLVPALVHGTRAVISTATKALQDQLATRDLPRLAETLGVPFEFAVLKGRSNYICRQRVAEISSGDEQMGLDGGAGGGSIGLGPLGREIRRLAEWATDAATGDRADLSWEPSPTAWSQVSVGATDCPGARNCPSGSVCFAEAARARALEADVVVVNTHLYATSLAAGPGDLLPAHDLVVFDEAHELEDIASAALGVEIGPGRIQALARTARALLDDPAGPAALEDAGGRFTDLLRPLRGEALPRPLDEDRQLSLTTIRERVNQVVAELRRQQRAAGDDRADSADTDGLAARCARAVQGGSHLQSDLDLVIGLTEDQVAWVEGPDHGPILRVAPLDVGDPLRARLWTGESAPVAVLTSATIPLRLGERLGLPAGSYDELDVGSPFAYDEQSLLYCPMHLPEPRHPGYEAAMHDELVALIEAAEGRTLGLFTSWRAMQAAVAAVAPRVAWPILSQSDLPKPALVAKFSTEEHSCLFATMGFWQGVDVPGSSLSVVTIDRLPFPRPDDPLLQARRAKAGRRAFEAIDVPRAATLLAQGTGRLIRSRTDRGVVAVLDTRLGKARYRWSLVNALPPMRRTRHRADVEKFLAPVISGAGPGPDGAASAPAEPAVP